MRLAQQGLCSVRVSSRNRSRARGPARRPGAPLAPARLGGWLDAQCRRLARSPAVWPDEQRFLAWALTISSDWRPYPGRVGAIAPVWCPVCVPRPHRMRAERQPAAASIPAADALAAPAPPRRRVAPIDQRSPQPSDHMLLGLGPPQHPPRPDIADPTWASSAPRAAAARFLMAHRLFSRSRSSCPARARRCGQHTCRLPSGAHASDLVRASRCASRSPRRPLRGPQRPAPPPPASPRERMSSSQLAARQPLIDALLAPSTTGAAVPCVVPRSPLPCWRARRAFERRRVACRLAHHRHRAACSIATVGPW